MWRKEQPLIGNKIVRTWNQMHIIYFQKSLMVKKTICCPRNSQRVIMKEACYSYFNLKLCKFNTCDNKAHVLHQPTNSRHWYRHSKVIVERRWHAIWDTGWTQTQLIAWNNKHAFTSCLLTNLATSVQNTTFSRPTSFPGGRPTNLEWSTGWSDIRWIVDHIPPATENSPFSKSFPGYLLGIN